MNLSAKLTTRPLCVIDIEGTGLDVAKDRIVTLAIQSMNPPRTGSVLFRCNPGREMSDEVIAVHGITNEMAAAWESFESQSQIIFTILDRCDLAGFNLLNYDIPILWEEFNRCGIEWVLDDI